MRWLDLNSFVVNIPSKVDSHFQLSSYLIYESSTRLDLLVCGLYRVNKRKWLQMVGSIVVHSSMLFQFHLVMRGGL